MVFWTAVGWSGGRVGAGVAEFLLKVNVSLPNDVGRPWGEEETFAIRIVFSSTNSMMVVVVFPEPSRVSRCAGLNEKSTVYAKISVLVAFPELTDQT